MKPWLVKQYCIPPQRNAAFVCSMEDILSVYKREFDPDYPLVCMDETSKQLIKETKQRIAAKPGRPELFDYEYERNGVCSIFMFCAPLLGKRHVAVSRRRTRSDWALQIKNLLDVHYPEAKKVILVMDNLNTHDGISLYETFPPEEARRLLDRLEIHHTPKHGSWLNIAEIELSVLSRQCISGRIPDIQTLAQKTSAWESRRNQAETKVDWRFTNEDARIKLKRLYPTLTE